MCADQYLLQDVLRASCVWLYNAASVEIFSMAISFIKLIAYLILVLMFLSVHVSCTYVTCTYNRFNSWYIHVCSVRVCVWLYAGAVVLSQW